MSNAALLAMGDRPIAFHPNLGRMVGSIKAGLFLSQALYWQNRVDEDRDGWWWHTQDEWTEETMMTRRECDSARKLLKEAGVLLTELRGSPAVTWYKVDLVKVDEMLTDLVAKRAAIEGGEGGDPCTKAPNQFGGKRQTRLAESAKPSIRAEITTEKNNPPTPHEQGTEPPTSEAPLTDEKPGVGSQDQKPPPEQTRRPGVPPDPPELVELALYIAGEIAAAMGSDPGAGVSAWLAQLRVMTQSGITPEALRAGWEFGRAHSAYQVAVMSPGGFNKHHEGLIVSARQAAPKSHASARCRGVNGAGCDNPATMGASGRNTHCPRCFDLQAGHDCEAQLGQGD